MICDCLASIFRSGREHFNQTYAEARRRYPELDNAVFTQFLTHTLNPIIANANQSTSASSSKYLADELSALVYAAYDIGLELAGERLIGPNQQRYRIEEGWREIVPSILSLVVGAPTKILTALSNAVHQVASTPGTRPEVWIASLKKLGQQCPDISTLLKLGQLLSWYCGMAHYREDALSIARQLPESLVRAALDIPNGAKTEETINRLQQDPWYIPSKTSSEKPKLRVVAKVGSFRGYGGQFTAPPAITVADDAPDGHFFVNSVHDCWLLCADAFGATLHRATPTEFFRSQEMAMRPAQPNDPKLDLAKDRITWDADTCTNPEPFGSISTYALSPTTLALTSAFSYQITLIARAP